MPILTFVKSWRYIPDGAQSASFNMAADAWLLDYAESPDAAPVLRLYDWNIPSITIGYHQEFERAVKADCLHDTPVVRRVTGGRALYHGINDITYSFSGNFERFSELGKTMPDRYRAIADAIIAYYGRLGLDARMSRRDAPVSLGKDRTVQKGCFAAVSQYEIVIGRSKMAASSQRYTRQSFIQHGAIRLGAVEEHPAIVSAVNDDDFDTNLSSVVTDEKRYEWLVSSFVDRFGARFDPKPFSPSELRKISRIEKSFENLNSG